jgi:uncharacterized protein
MTQSGGRGPVLTWITLKIAQRCNLNCTYCYVYNRGDDSWRTRPVFVDEKVLSALGSRIAEHCATYGLSAFTIELHGGEPLLLGKRRFQRLIDILRAQCPDVLLRFILQTNGLLLDQEWLEVFDRNGVTFGLSLDGPPEIADRHRVRHNGTGSTVELLRIVADLRRDGPLFDELNGGVLCVVDDPVVPGRDLLRFFADLGFRQVDFLLPDGNHANLPPGWRGPEPFQEFLVDAFEAWYELGLAAPRVRKFEVMVRAFMGQRPVLDSLGGDLRGLCVVETDGSIGISDVGRICGGRFSRDELSIFEHPLDLHATHYGLDEVQELCGDCQACPFSRVTGGGYLPHRFDGVSFQNPSIYCPALCGLASVVYERLREDIPAELWRRV